VGGSAVAERRYDRGAMLKDLAAWLGVGASYLSGQLGKARREQVRSSLSPIEKWLEDKGDLIALARPDSPIAKHRESAQTHAGRCRCQISHLNPRSDGSAWRARKPRAAKDGSATLKPIEGERVATPPWAGFVRL
jgi:hypothetical protein